jgi:hypothetical protein
MYFFFIVGLLALVITLLSANRPLIIHHLTAARALVSTPAPANSQFGGTTYAANPVANREANAHFAVF